MAFTVIAGPKTFTGADGTNLSDDSDWQEQDGSGGFVRIYDNGFRNGFGAMSDVCWKGTGSFTRDQFAEFTLLGNTDQSDIVGVNLLNDGLTFGLFDCYRCVYDGNNAGQLLAIFKVTNGTQAGSPLGTVAGNLATGTKIRCAVVQNGANNDFQFYTDTGGGYATYGSVITDSSSPFTSGKPGCSALNASGLMRGDDWQAGNVTAGGGASILRQMIANH
jgi:hypothetical protein